MHHQSHSVIITAATKQSIPFRKSCATNWIFESPVSWFICVVTCRLCHTTYMQAAGVGGRAAKTKRDNFMIEIWKMLINQLGLRVEPGFFPQSSRWLDFMLLSGLCVCAAVEHYVAIFGSFSKTFSLIRDQRPTAKWHTFISNQRDNNGIKNMW